MNSRVNQEEEMYQLQKGKESLTLLKFGSKTLRSLGEKSGSRLGIEEMIKMILNYIYRMEFMVTMTVSSNVLTVNSF